MCWDACGQEVKIWFGSGPERGICLDVAHKGGCVSSVCLQPIPLCAFTAYSSCGVSEYCVHLHMDALVYLGLSSNAINHRGIVRIMQLKVEAKQEAVLSTVHK